MNSSNPSKNKKPPVTPPAVPNDAKFARLIKSARVIRGDGDIDDDRELLNEQTLRERETDRIGTEKYYELRDKWSVYIKNFVWAMLAYQLLLTMAIGLNWFDFTDYGFFLNLVIGQNFAQIVGMGAIIVAFLFPRKK